ncbi:MAG: histidine kinase dimerization/phosphoacceptor domain -containing protein [Candidatus Methanomethylophilaceae archaeon]|nr:histidine kinase dimerization/phosphoacceptor domain -containing protein [Candidatus Methanomethylophilaceae archaeon]
MPLHVGDEDSASRTDSLYRRIHRSLLILSGYRLTRRQEKAILGMVTLTVVAISILGLNSGVNDIFPHLFYIPIVLAAFWYPNAGFPVAAALAALYISEFYIFQNLMGTVPSTEWPAVVSRSLIFLLIGSVMTLLRWEGAVLNDIIRQSRKFVYLNDGKRGDFYFSPSVHALLPTDASNKMETEGVEALLSPEDKGVYQAMRQDVFRGQEAKAFLQLPGEDGMMVTSFHLTPIHRRGRVAGFKAMVEDVTASKGYEARMQTALEEKTVLLAEVHHRVRNNLAIVDSFINMQMMSTDDPGVRSCLHDMENRIMTISEVHSSIYQDERVVDMNLSPHIRKLFQNNHQTYSSGRQVSLDLQVEDVPMSFDMVMDLSLVINELFSNSFKHAFVGRDQGSIMISLQPEGEGIILRYQDDGPGLQGAVDIGGRTFGLHLIDRMVVGKLKGSYRPQNGENPRWEIRVPT